MDLTSIGFVRDESCRWSETPLGRVLPGFEWAPQDIVEGYDFLRLIRRAMEAPDQDKSGERKRAVDSAGLGKTLAPIEHEGSSVKARFPQPLENAGFCLRMRLDLIDGAFPTLPTAPATIFNQQKMIQRQPHPPQTAPSGGDQHERRGDQGTEAGLRGVSEEDRADVQGVGDARKDVLGQARYDTTLDASSIEVSRTFQAHGVTWPEEEVKALAERVYEYSHGVFFSTLFWPFWGLDNGANLNKEGPKLMKITVYNSQKSRLETIDVQVTEENTTWFDNCADAHDIHMITDIEGGILISEYGYSYPFWIYDKSRAEIDYSQQKALELRRMYE